MKLKRILLPLVLLLTLFTAAFAANKPVSDDFLVDTIRQKLAADQVVKGGAIDVTVKDGVVTLAGKVAETKQKARAERLAHGIKGVKSVLIMIDNEGNLGDPNTDKRTQAIERHYPWIEAAKFLVKSRDVVGLGIDTMSVDKGATTDYPVHVFTSRQSVYHLENVANLALVPPSGATVVVAPLKLAAVSPVLMKLYREAEMTLGSRFLQPGGPAAGGMPRYKIVANRFLTTVENYVLGTHFSELHTGYRAYSRQLLLTVPFLRNSIDFVFDSELPRTDGP